MAHPPELRKRAKELRSQGLLIRVIAADLGVPKPTVIRWLNPELEKRDRRRARKLKFSEKKRCTRCKTKRASNNADLCDRCYHASQRYWTQEKLIEAVQTWAIEKGSPPVYSDWMRSGGKKHPAIRSIVDGPNPPFQTWTELLKAAGFDPRKRRRARLSIDERARRAELRKKIREGRIKKAIEKGEQE
jgi:IS30 family transposase